MDKIGGRTLAAWNKQWRPVPEGLTNGLDDYKTVVGVFRLRLAGTVVFVGVGTDLRDGLRKRLVDFVRRSPSGRGHHAGRLIHEHSAALALEVLPTGFDREAVTTALQLRRALVEQHRPEWNARVKRAG